MYYPEKKQKFVDVHATYSSSFVLGLQAKHKIEEKYLHPWIRGFSCVRRYIKLENVKPVYELKDLLPVK